MALGRSQDRTDASVHLTRAERQDLLHFPVASRMSRRRPSEVQFQMLPASLKSARRTSPSACAAVR